MYIYSKHLSVGRKSLANSVSSPQRQLQPESRPITHNGHLIARQSYMESSERTENKRNYHDSMHNEFQGGVFLGTTMTFTVDGQVPEICREELPHDLSVS